MAFKTNFGPRDVPKLENLHFHFYAFSGWATFRGPKLFLKAVFTQIPIYLLDSGLLDSF